MPRPSPYPPLELDLDDMSASGLRPAPTLDGAQAPSDTRNTVPPAFDLEEFAKEIMSEAPDDAPLMLDSPDPPESDVRAISDAAKVSSDAARTAPPPATSLYPKSAPSSSPGALHVELDDLLASRDHRAALVVAEEILADDPDDIRAKAAALRCHATLEQMYVERLGALEQVPRVLVPIEDIPNLALDHRSGFILSLIDGTCTLDMILDMASMARLDVLRVLLELTQQGTIVLE